MNEIEFLEKYLGIKLLWYQKILLKVMWMKKPEVYIYRSRGSKKWGREIAQCMLNELGGEENDSED